MPGTAPVTHKVYFITALLYSFAGCDRSHSTADEVFVADLERLAPSPGQDPPRGIMLRADRGPAFTYLLAAITDQSRERFLDGRELQRHSPICEGVVFRCNPRLGKVELASCDDWNRAREQIMVSLPDARNERFSELKIKNASGRLVYRNGAVRTAGREALYWAPSFDGTRIAVLSAEEEGKRSGISMPFMGGGRGRAKGKRTHELFAFPEMTPLGGAITLPGCEDRDPIPVWSADSQFVAYFDPHVFRAWFVGIQKPGESRP